MTRFIRFVHNLRAAWARGYELGSLPQAQEVPSGLRGSDLTALECKCGRMPGHVRAKASGCFQ